MIPMVFITTSPSPATVTPNKQTNNAVKWGLAYALVHLDVVEPKIEGP